MFTIVAKRVSSLPSLFGCWCPATKHHSIALPQLWKHSPITYPVCTPAYQHDFSIRSGTRLSATAWMPLYMAYHLVHIVGAGIPWKKHWSVTRNSWHVARNGIIYSHLPLLKATANISWLAQSQWICFWTCVTLHSQPETRSLGNRVWSNRVPFPT